MKRKQTHGVYIAGLVLGITATLAASCGLQSESESPTLANGNIDESMRPVARLVLKEGQTRQFVTAQQKKCQLTLDHVTTYEDYDPDISGTLRCDHGSDTFSQQDVAKPWVSQVLNLTIVFDLESNETNEITSNFGGVYRIGCMVYDPSKPSAAEPNTPKNNTIYNSSDKYLLCGKNCPPETHDCVGIMNSFDGTRLNVTGLLGQQPGPYNALCVPKRRGEEAPTAEEICADATEDSDNGNGSMFRECTNTDGLHGWSYCRATGGVARFFACDSITAEAAAAFGKYLTDFNPHYWSIAAK